MLRTGSNLPLVNFIAPTPTPNATKDGFPVSPPPNDAKGRKISSHDRLHQQGTWASRSRSKSPAEVEMIQGRRKARVQRTKSRKEHSGKGSPSAKTKTSGGGSKKRSKKDKAVLLSLTVASDSDSTSISRSGSGRFSSGSGSGGVGASQRVREREQYLPAGANRLFELINVVRTDPSAALADLREEIEFLEDENNMTLAPSDAEHTYSLFKYPDHDPRAKKHPKGIRMQERRRAVFEAVHFLERQVPLRAVRWKIGLSMAALDHASDVGLKGLGGSVGTEGSNTRDRAARYGRSYGHLLETIDYGDFFLKRTVLNMIIDDGNPSRSRRLALFDPDMRVLGVATSPHRTCGSIAVLVFAARYTDYGVGNQQAEHQARQDLLIKQSDGSIPCPGCKNLIVHPSPSDETQFEFYLKSTAFVGPREWHVGCLQCMTCQRLLQPQDVYNLDGSPHCQTCAERVVGATLS